MAVEIDESQWAVLDHTLLNDDIKRRVIGAMNAQYKEALNVCVRHFCGQTGVVSAQLAELDETKVVMRYWDAEAQLQEKSITYQNSAGVTVRANKAGDVRRILFEMARTASSITGDVLDLPLIVSQLSDKVPGAYFLNDFIDLSTVECLNQDDAHPVTNAIRSSSGGEEGEETVLQSDPDVDHQLLIKLAFRQPVKLKAMTLHGRTEDGTAPMTLKIFQGQMSIGFQEAEEDEATQTLDLSASQVDSGEPITLKFVKFQNVSSLQIFVQSNFGADTTRINQLDFLGSLCETVDMKSWKPASNDMANPNFPIAESRSEDPTMG